MELVGRGEVQQDRGEGVLAEDDLRDHRRKLNLVGIFLSESCLVETVKEESGRRWEIDGTVNQAASIVIRSRPGEGRTIPAHRS